MAGRFQTWRSSIYRVRHKYLYLFSAASGFGRCDYAHRRGDISLELLLIRFLGIAFRAGGDDGGCDCGEAYGQARDAGHVAEPAAPLQLLFQVTHLGLAFRAGPGTITLVPAFLRYEFYVIRLGDLPSDLLEDPAYFFSSFHLCLFYIRSCQNR